MNIEEIADQLNGSEYLFETTEEIQQNAKDAGIVIVFGASDDMMEFRGAIDDEVGCYDGDYVLIDTEGLLPNRENIDNYEELEQFFIRKKEAIELHAVWCDTDEYSWTYKTNIPHVTFDIMEDSDKYCYGIVFKLADVKR